MTISESAAEKLADLSDTFNTNQGFGLMGMLENQDPQARENDQRVVPDQQAKSKDNDPSVWVDTLNSSIQQTNAQLMDRLAQIENRVATPQQQPVQQVDEQGQLVQPDPYVQRMDQLQAQTAYTRATQSLMDFKQRNPDTELSKADLDKVWRESNLDAAPQAAAIANFDEYWINEDAKRRTPKLSDENKRLKAELEQLKNGRSQVNDLNAIPRNTRSVTNQPTQRMSTNQNADGVDEDVYAEATKKMTKGKFIGFGQAIADARRKRQLAAAV